MKRPTIREFSSSVVRVTLLYALFAGLWIFISDRLLATLTSDFQQLTEWQTYKEWIAVAVTTVGLFVLLSIGRSAEQALRKSEQKFSTLFEKSAFVAALARLPDGVLVHVNEAFEKTFGYTKAEAIGKTSLELGINPDAASRLRILAELEAGSSAHGIELALHTKSNGTRVFRENIDLIDIGGDKFILTTSEDITERKRMASELQQSEKFLRQVIDLVPHFIFAKDSESRFLLTNKAVADAYGTTVIDIVGKSDIDFSATPEQVRHFHEDDLAVIEKGKPKLIPEELIRDVDGNTRYLQTTKIPFQFGPANVPSILGVSVDITERKMAEEKIKRQLEHLSALRAIDMAIASSFDLKVSLDILLKEVSRQLGVDAVSVLLFNSNSQMLEFTAGHGFRTNAFEHMQLSVRKSYAGRAVLDRQIVHITNLKKPPEGFTRTSLLVSEDFTCYYGVPLISKGKVKGVLEIFHRSPLEPDQEWLDFLNTLAGQAAIAVDNAELFENLQRSNLDLRLAYDATIAGWSHALDLRDKETEGHTQRVTEMTIELARAFGLNEEELIYVRWGGLLHDIGKMGVPDGILLKPDKLTDEEWVIMKKHPEFAYDMLFPIRYLKSAIDIPYCHHEKWDGTGYPRGLKGEQIPLTARIFAVVDIWDAIRSDRPYRPAWKKEKALEHIKSLSGSHLDPKVADAFLEMIRGKEL